MRTQEEKDAKIQELQEQINKGIGDSYILQVQIDIIEGDDSAENYEDSEDSWLHQGAESAQGWLDGRDDELQ